MPAIGCPPTKRASRPAALTSSSTAPFTLMTSVSGQSGAAESRMCPSMMGSAGMGTARTIRASLLGRPRQRLVQAVGRVEPVEPCGLDPLDRPVVAENLAAGRRRGPHHRTADETQTQHAHGCLRHGPRLAHSPDSADGGMSWIAGQSARSGTTVAPWEHSVHRRRTRPSTSPTASAWPSSARTASGAARRCVPPP